MAVVVASAACTSGGTAHVAPTSTSIPAPPPTSAPTSPLPEITTTTAATTAAPSRPIPVPTSSLPHVPDTPAALAAALATTEGAIHDPGTPLSAVPGLGATEQRLVATLATHPAWAAAVTAALPATLRAAVTGPATADAELSAVPGPTPTAIPPWTVVAPRPADELLADYRQAQAASAVPWTVLAAINLVETRMGRIVGPSSAGAQGPMQFLPSTWARYGRGGDIHDAGAAIAAAARFLRANGAPGDLSAALYHYNPSVHYVRAVLALSGVMTADVRAFYGYYGWRVYVGTTAGTFLLPEGYGR